MSSLLQASPEGAPVALATLAVGSAGLVAEVLVPGSDGERLMEMGLTPGSRLRVVRRGLRGDPLQIEVRGYMLTLRRVLAEQVRVARQDA